MPFGLWSGVPDIITHAKFYVKRLRDFTAAAPRKWPFPILFRTTLTTVLHYRADFDCILTRIQCLQIHSDELQHVLSALQTRLVCNQATNGLLGYQTTTVRNLEISTREDPTKILSTDCANVCRVPSGLPRLYRNGIFTDFPRYSYEMTNDVAGDRAQRSSLSTSVHSRSQFTGLWPAN